MITFNEKTHQYFDQNGVEYQSVTRILKKHYPFDTEGIIRQIQNNPKSKYFKKTREEILKIWDNKAQLGTNVHKKVENYIKNYVYPDKEDKDYDIIKNFGRIKFNGYLQAEKIVYDTRLLIAGTVDIIEDTERGCRIWDIKTCGTIDKKKHEQYSCQLEIYARFINTLTNREAIPAGLIWIDITNNKFKILPYLNVKNKVDNILKEYRKA